MSLSSLHVYSTINFSMSPSKCYAQTVNETRLKGVKQGLKNREGGFRTTEGSQHAHTFTLVRVSGLKLVIREGNCGFTAVEFHKYLCYFQHKAPPCGTINTTPPPKGPQKLDNRVTALD